MGNLVVIPARYASSRFPGKPLTKIKLNGEEKTLIEITWNAARRLKLDKRLIIATDDTRIERECKKFGAEVIITSKNCRNGTERVAEAVRLLKDKSDVIFNFQGDSPLIPDDYVYSLLESMKDGDISVATPIIKMDSKLYLDIKRDIEANSIGATSVVVKKNFDALYFSKTIIPTVHPKKNFDCPFYFHVGLYAYTRNALENYAQMGPGFLEEQEGLEQLRFIENGVEVKCVLVGKKGSRVWEVNNPSDIIVVERLLKSGSF
ncbi:3-deoxy-manno-octulosonate cytidylyltransferase [Paracoccaceae bacterium]|nr:3-deoxy-manno-octulosonate cytidylyltransferase [Paracoccaceae bacterium]